MPRKPDSAIPANESLYRSIEANDVVNDDILPSAVDAPRCSFNRSQYSSPEDVLTSNRPQDTGIAEVTPERLPEPLARDGANPLEFVAEDDPNPVDDPDNEAHCEVRVKPQGSPFNKNFKLPKALKPAVLNRLARTLKIYERPT